MLDLLRTDGRASLTDLAATTGRSLTTERRRLAELRATGALYFDGDLDYHLLNLRMQTMLWLGAPPDQLMATGQALAAHPEVPFVAATTGSTNLYASVLCPDPAILFTYLTTQVAALPATNRIETAPVI
jgi:DNA-binding Lrp family transcriptional regulator